MLKCTIFDLGNTIVDLRRALDDAHRFDRDKFAELGYNFTVGEIKSAREKTIRAIKRKYRESVAQYEAGIFHKYMGKFLKAPVSARDCARLDSEFIDWMTSRSKLAPSITTVLDFCMARYHVALIANSNRRAAEKILEYFSLKKYFKTIITSEEVGMKKRSLEPFKTFLKMTGHQPDECVMIGDNPEEDLAAARLGMKTILALYSSSETQRRIIKPDFIAKNSADIIKALKSLDRK